MLVFTYAKELNPRIAISEVFAANRPTLGDIQVAIGETSIYLNADEALDFAADLETFAADLLARRNIEAEQRA